MADILQWEYRFESLGSTWKSLSDEEVQAVLNEWGVDGWEVTEMAYYSAQLKVVAKRPLTREVRRQRGMPGTV